jgi:hypothetical protein
VATAIRASEVASGPAPGSVMPNSTLRGLAVLPSANPHEVALKAEKSGLAMPSKSSTGFPFILTRKFPDMSANLHYINYIRVLTPTMRIGGTDVRGPATADSFSPSGHSKRRKCL